MKTKLPLLLLLCFSVLSILAACADTSANTDPIRINLKKNSYQFGDNKIQYVLTNDYDIDKEIDCYSYGYLERKIDDNWEVVPSTKPDPVAWCGTFNTLRKGNTDASISFLSYNGTLAAGTYRIAIDYTVRYEDTRYAVRSEEFVLTGEFPMSKGYPPPANVYLYFDNDSFSKSLSELSYKIINESGGEVYISPKITLMLHQDTSWNSFVYDTGADSEITSADSEIFRTIDAKKLPSGFDNYSDIRIIEEIAIPMRNVFYVFHEISMGIE